MGKLRGSWNCSSGCGRFALLRNASIWTPCVPTGNSPVAIDRVLAVHDGRSGRGHGARWGRDKPNHSRGHRYAVVGNRAGYNDPLWLPITVATAKEDYGEEV